MAEFRRLLCVVLLSGCTLSGAVLLSVPDLDNGPGSADAVGAGIQQIAAASFTLGGAYTNVGISLDLRDSADGVQVLAYLMTQTGPGTSVAHEIATGTATTVFTDPLTPLFSGLSLGPGTYYIVLTATSGIGYWSLGNNLLATTVGATPGQGFFSSSCDAEYGCYNAVYPPASTFVDYNPCCGVGVVPWHTYALEVTADAGVPEPGYGAIVGCFAIAVTIYRRQKVGAPRTVRWP